MTLDGQKEGRSIIVSKDYAIQTLHQGGGTIERWKFTEVDKRPGDTVELIITIGRQGVLRAIIDLIDEKEVKFHL